MSIWAEKTPGLHAVQFANADCIRSRFLELGRPNASADSVIHGAGGGDEKFSLNPAFAPAYARAFAAIEVATSAVQLHSA